MGVRFAATLVLAGFVSWLSTFAFDCYYRQPSSPGGKHPRDQDPPFPGGSLDNVFWFLQISDIHLSIVNNLAIADDLTYFCSRVVSLVSPSLVLVTGDLTHAKFADERCSQQFEEEWRAYAEVLERTGVCEKLPWLDIRGNHDNFDVVSSSDRFRHYSSSWRDHSSHSYRYTHPTSFGNYTFIAMDACPFPGPKRPYNFFGILHEEDLKSLQLLVSTAAHDNHTVWFSHYPSATITADHQQLRAIMSSSMAHVCGHLHTIANFVPRMYGRHPSGHLELELGDFKDNRKFRLLAFDHDLFSFVDTTLRQWPLVLVTSPKDAHFSLARREPLGRVRHSSHVRILAFSPNLITSVRVWVDKHPLPRATPVGGGPLYVSPWQPEKYSAGLHTIQVIVKDSSGQECNVTQLFSLDGTAPPLPLLPEMLLLTDLRSLLQMVFLFLWLSFLGVLVLGWLENRQTSHFHMLVRTKSVFHPFIAYILYFGIGPWYIGELLTGVYGLVGVHGVIVAGHFLPGSLTYLHGGLQVLLFQLPLACYLNSLLSRDRSCGCRSLPCHLGMLVVFLLQCMSILSTSPYGLVAILISPGISWTLPLTLYLIFRALRTDSRNSLHIPKSN